MESDEPRYPGDHWIRSHDPEAALQVYLEQQAKSYSQVKNAFVQELAGDLHGARVLDYGCGGGWFSVHAACQGAAQVVGVDREEPVVQTARHFARTRGVEGACRFFTTDGFPDFPPLTKFDVVVLKDVIEHVPADERLLESISRVMQPGGKLVVSTQNAMSINYLVEGSYKRYVRGDREWCGWDPTHVRFYTPMSLRRKLRNTGFSVKHWRSVYIIPYKLPAPSFSRKQFVRLDVLSRVDTVLGRHFPYNLLGWNIIVQARASTLVKQRVKLPRLKPAMPVPGAAPSTAGAAPLGVSCNVSSREDRSAPTRQPI